MADAKNKTTQNAVDPRAFVESVEHDKRREDSLALLDFFGRVTGLEPKMWGPSIIGYGRYHYKYDSGREGEFMLTGFSPRKTSLTLYIMPGYQFSKMQDRLSRLGKHKLGKSCLYINKLEDVDMDVLEEIVHAGVSHMRDKYETWDE